MSSRKAFGYIRVSTTDQAENGDSLPAQRARIGAWAVAHDYQLVNVFEDAGISGYKVSCRPGVKEAIKAACQEGAVLVVYSLSRLSRSTREAIELLDTIRAAGGDLVSLSEGFDTTTPAGKALFKMIAVFAEFERDVISERIRDVMQSRKQRGLKNGGTTPFGWNVDGETLIPNDREQKVIETMQRLRRQGLSLRSIGSQLQRRGIKTKTGKPNWAPNVIQAILREAA